MPTPKLEKSVLNNALVLLSSAVLVFQLFILMNERSEVQLNFVAVTIIMSVLLLIGITGRRYEETSFLQTQVLNTLLE